MSRAGLDRSCGKNTPCDLPNTHCQYPKCEYGKNKVGPITSEDAIPGADDNMRQNDAMRVWADGRAVRVIDALRDDNAEALALLREARDCVIECKHGKTGHHQALLARIDALLSKHTQGASK